MTHGLGHPLSKPAPLGSGKAAPQARWPVLATALAMAMAMALAMALVPALIGCQPAPEPDPATPAASVASSRLTPQSSGTITGSVPTAAQLIASADAILASHRQMIVLMSDERGLPAAQRRALAAVGLQLFHQQNQLTETLTQASLAASDAPALAAVEALLDRIESAPDWFDADRLAFKDFLARLSERFALSQSLSVLKLARRVNDDLAVLAEIEQAYDRELKDIFGRFAQRGIELKREKWADYVAKLQRLYQREQILKEHGGIVAYTEPLGEPTAPAAASAPSPAASTPAGTPPATQRGDKVTAKPGDGAAASQRSPSSEAREVFGASLPPKTVVLTFDDGPHPRYTDEILEILARYSAPAIFFQLGRNLGTVDAQGQAKPGAQAAVAKRVLQAGHVLANHSFSHGVLAKMSPEAVRSEASQTESLLDASGRSPSKLFRFPYGARNAESLSTVEGLHLRSMMWNIDSMDWADPVPKSIAERVLSETRKTQRGVILFHDIHGRTAQALPLVLDQLLAEGYRFATWRDGQFVLPAATAAPSDTLPAAAGDTLYRDSHALVIGIDGYGQWPRLAHAVRDAQAIEAALVKQLGFPAGNVTTLLDGQASRANILRALNDKLANPLRVKRDDRVFVFFAGHGATRRLPSGREVGYLIPADAGAGDLATDGISMPQLQEVAEAISAKHVLFILDACYSGLGLTRAGGRDSGRDPAASPTRFLSDNARRIGRQMMTAGGADQQVADDGPGGHSVFTWTLLQALSGKADLNGDGFITGTELAAYVAPSVAAISRQTPAFGSLPGSAGGEFIFQVNADHEPLSADTRQLDAAASALAKRMDQARDPTKPGTAPTLQVAVRHLDGSTQRLSTPAAQAQPARVAAQQANDRGLALYRERRYDEAEAAFTEALKLQPTLALAANNLGFVHWKRGKHLEASSWFAQAVALDPSRALAHLNLADAHLQLGNDGAAQGAYARFVALQPQHPRSAELQAWVVQPSDTAKRPKLPATSP